jgi:hypothetical protein
MRKSAQQKLIDARIQQAITGFQIPMLSIPKLYAHLDHAIRAQVSSQRLKEIVATFPGVKAS